MSAPPISHILGPISLSPRALAKRTPLRYSDNLKIRALLAKPSWSVRQRLLPKHIRDRPPQPGQLEDRLQQIAESGRWTYQRRSSSRRRLSPSSPRAPARLSIDVVVVGGDDKIDKGQEGEDKDKDEDEENEEDGDITVSVETLRHLLRLSALPPPAEDSADERAMLRDLRSQIHFVRQMQRVDVDGVEPLVAIRDESEAAVDEARVGLADEEIRAVLEAEEVVGRGGEFERTRRKKTNDDNGNNYNNDQQQQQMEWDPFELGVGSEQASSGRRAGRWFVVKKREKSKKEEQQQQQQERQEG